MKGIEEGYPLGRERFESAVRWFPLQGDFRKADAYYMVYWHSLGVTSSRDAIAAVKKALKTIPNSAYMQQHLRRLEGR